MSEKPLVELSLSERMREAKRLAADGVRAGIWGIVSPDATFHIDLAIDDWIAEVAALERQLAAMREALKEAKIMCDSYLLQIAVMQEAMQKVSDADDEHDIIAETVAARDALDELRKAAGG